MAVLSNTGNAVPISGAESDVVAIAPGTPLDNVTVYVKGGAGRQLQYALYATVGAVRTRVAQASIIGSNVATIIAWQTIGKGDGQTERVDAGGTTYTVTVIDQSGLPGAAPAVTATIAGVDDFDTAADQDASAAFALGPGGSGALATFGGYAQLMDVAINQARLSPVNVTVEADCGAGSVLAVVKEAQMSGVDGGIASVFRGLQLPVATRYFVSVSNESNQNVNTTLAAVTYSVSITAGGVVVLNGDVIGPSNANTVIKWENVPLNAASMGAPAVGDVPIFNADGSWHAGTAGAAIALVGNTNGPANANTDEHFVTSTTDANVNIAAQANPKGFLYEGLNGLTADRTVFLNTTATGAVGDQTIVKDEDGSLAAHNIIIDPGAGNTIDGAATYTMTAAQNGIKGSVTLVRISATAWALV